MNFKFLIEGLIFGYAVGMPISLGIYFKFVEDRELLSFGIISIVIAWMIILILILAETNRLSRENEKLKLELDRGD